MSISDKIDILAALFFKKESKFERRIYLNLETLYKQKRKLHISGQKLDFKIQKMKSKKNRISRKERAHRLLMLGILLEKADILSTSEEVLLGFFLEFKNISAVQEAKYKQEGTRLLEKTNNSQTARVIELHNMTYLEKKARAHRLISKAALLETASISTKDKVILAGYFLDFKNRSDIQKQRYLEIGTVALKNNKRS